MQLADGFRTSRKAFLGLLEQLREPHWWFLWVFVFVAYLFALFAIMGDLVRDRHLSGWWKAVRVVFLIFVPFLTALIYLVARGNSMADRNATEAARIVGGA